MSAHTTVSGPGTAPHAAETPAKTSALAVEMAGADIIPDSERKGHPRGLFWPWFAANISPLAIPYGAWLLGFNISFWQALVAGLIGIVFSFALCGFVAVAGKRGSAPTMILSRAAMGVHGNRIASGLSWILTVGWETVLASLAVLATATVFDKMGWGSGSHIKIIALIVVAVLVVGGGIVGFDLVMKIQTWITVITGILTIGYFALTWNQLDFHALSQIQGGSTAQLIGGLVFMMTGFGLGWVNMAADYSRYLPRNASSGKVMWWTTFSASLAPILLVVFGLLLAGSKGLDSEFTNNLSADPIGALTGAIPTWFVIPFFIVALLGLVGGALLDIYSSGLALVSTGLPIKRPVAAAIDGTIMVIGTIYIVFSGSTFIDLFQGFLITLGVPIAVWAGIMLADVALRKKDYDEVDLFNPRGRYGNVPATPLLVMIIGTVLGWGLVTNGYASWLSWQGYLLKPFGLGGRGGDWATANLGVLAALVIGFLATLIFRAAAVRRQEAQAATPKPGEAAAHVQAHHTNPPTHNAAKAPGKATLDDAKTEKKTPAKKKAPATARTAPSGEAMAQAVKEHTQRTRREGTK
ncbi:MAG: cytosine permease [Bifidobacteriaceae bacterium]|jgi:purine-cytosine permease-like protein|nr:cytosine permease [Bifidobacteriaceae bacterium]